MWCGLAHETHIKWWAKTLNSVLACKAGHLGLEKQQEQKHSMKARSALKADQNFGVAGGKAQNGEWLEMKPGRSRVGKGRPCATVQHWYCVSRVWGPKEALERGVWELRSLLDPCSWIWRGQQEAGYREQTTQQMLDRRGDDASPGWSGSRGEEDEHIWNTFKK